MQRPQAVRKSLAAVVRMLEKSRFVQAETDASGHIAYLELLQNGIVYGDNLRLQWKAARSELHTTTATHFVDDIDGAAARTRSRRAFISSPQFLYHINHLQQKCDAACPAVVKVDSHIPYAGITSSPSAPCNGFLPFVPTFVGSTYLVTDCFLPPAYGLEKFHNIQRERKIWWMRFSANPSRYFVDPCELAAHEELDDVLSGVGQSITIKSRFPFGDADVEHITLVPLHQTPLKDSAKYQLKDRQNRQELVVPTVIRSVIDLEAATCAMLFDASDHNREDTLFLNRKLVPFQCAIACLHKGELSDEMKDLRKHLFVVVRRAGLRIFDEHELSSPCRQQLDEEFHTADTIGIPYTLLIDEESLRTGLLQLRNRDTTLVEAIHISDIPDYLLNIFNC